MERRPTGEISLVVHQFSLVLEANVEYDKKVYNETNPYYGVFRALKTTLQSQEINSMSLSTPDYYSIVSFLLDDEISATAFREWINLGEFEWEMGWLPKNARRLYAIGKQEILRNSGIKNHKK